MADEYITLEGWIQQDTPETGRARQSLSYWTGHMQTDNQSVVDFAYEIKQATIFCTMSVREVLDTPPGRLDIMAEDDLVSDARPIQASGGWAVTAAGGSEGDGAYSSPGDRLSVMLVYADGTTGIRVLPCPKETIFEADDYTLDMTDVTVMSWITTLVFYAANSDDSPAVGVRRGWRWQT